MMAAYNKSKLCNVLFARALAEKTAGTGEWLRVGGRACNDAGFYLSLQFALFKDRFSHFLSLP